MKRILGCLRRADADFHMINPGDTVAVGVSGGKDSVMLLYAMSLYRRFSPNPFNLKAVTVTMGLEPFNLSEIKSLCEKLDVPYIVRETQIGEIVFSAREEKNPCALCARMRRGALVAACVSAGCNKLALGHHRDDALETLLMSIFYERRFHTFQPVTQFDENNVSQIRPLIYVPEKDIARMHTRLELPIVKSPCPVDGKTTRQDMKNLLDDLSKRIPNARKLLLEALQNDKAYELWDKPE